MFAERRRQADMRRMKLVRRSDVKHLDRRVCAERFDGFMTGRAEVFFKLDKNSGRSIANDFSLFDQRTKPL